MNRELSRSKRGKLLSLSLTNNIDVLREKLYMEIARRNRLRNQNQVGRSAIHFKYITPKISTGKPEQSKGC